MACGRTAVDSRRNLSTEQIMSHSHVLEMTFTELHVVNLFVRYEVGCDAVPPLDLHVMRYLRAYRRIGSNQRRIIVQLVYDMQRWLLLVDYLVEQCLVNQYAAWDTLLDNGVSMGEPNAKVSGLWDSVTNPRVREAVIRWRKRYYVFCELVIKNEAILQWITSLGKKRGNSLEAIAKRLGPQHPISKQMNSHVQKEMNSAPNHIKVSFPSTLFDKIANSIGNKQQAMAFCRTSNTQAPVCIRMNPSKVQSRKILIERLRGSLRQWLRKSGRKNTQFALTPTEHSPYGVIVQTASNSRINFHELEEFRDGWFEVQDEASQLVADLIQVQPGDTVLDYCAGSGGKTLAFAHRMNNEGKIYLSDVRYGIEEEVGDSSALLLDTKRRLRRSGVQNAVLLSPGSSHHIGKVDWLLLDVPCSGTGTLRRHPDLKYRIGHAELEKYVTLQRNIIGDALPFLDLSKPASRFVYVTCSILKDENMNQVQYILEQYGNVLELEKTFSTVTEPDGHDGFFAATFRPINNSHRSI